jgi:hypothetical protein
VAPTTTKGQLTELPQLDLLFQFLYLALQSVSPFFGCETQSSRVQDERPSNALDGVCRDNSESGHTHTKLGSASCDVETNLRQLRLV